ncbi:MAG: hypothetical protein E7369_03120 [Clostridiales bacterium]|nr:hypothetical protein [Clostridiales bacterium]
MQVGDIVVSLAGRDKDKYFLVIGVDDKSCTIVDGKIRKLDSPKRKNKKHLKVIFTVNGKCLAERINSGKPTGNETLKRFLKDHLKSNIGG